MTIEQTNTVKNLALSRRQFLRWALLMGIPVVTGLSTYAVQAPQLSYLLEKSKIKPKPKEATVLLTKLIDRAKDSWEIGGGTFITPSTILTVAHLQVDSNFTYATEPNFKQAYVEKRQVEQNIKETVTHPTLDLALVKLHVPVAGAIATITNQPLYVTNGPLTLAATSSLARLESYAGYVDDITDRDQFNQTLENESILLCRNNAASAGDSGTGIYLENSSRLVGVCLGGSQSPLFGLNPRSFYVNLTTPSVYQWIMVNK